MKILDGTAGSNAGNGDVVTFHAGANAGQTFTATFGDFETVRDKTVAASAVTTSARIDDYRHGYATGLRLFMPKVVRRWFTDGTSYYVIKVDANTIKLATTKQMQRRIHRRQLLLLR